jgi:NADH-quinone oxidoreductase subunit K
MMPQLTMQPIVMEQGLMLAAILFVLGMIGVLTRRNVIFVLMSLEIMLNATALAFVVAGSRWSGTDGQIMYLMILSLAGAEVAVGLGLVIQLFNRFKTLDLNVLSKMKG